MKTKLNARRLTALSSCLLIAMTSFFATPSWGQSGAGPNTAKQTDKGTTAVKPEQAEQNLINRVAPVYPPLAKDLRLQGKVKVQVVISKTGMVESANVVSGHPLLVQAAINAVKQWQYKPFLADGQPVTVSTEVEVPFSLGISDANYQAEQKSNDDAAKAAVKGALRRGAAGDNWTVEKLADGSVTITREVAGQAGGRAAYEQVIDGATGVTKSVVQKAYDSAGNLVHVDPKFP